MNYGLKRRTIKQIIEKKLDEWQFTLPDELRANIQDHIIVTGGCIASLLLGEQVNDFDLYCDDTNTAIKLAQHYVDKFNQKRTLKSNYTKVPFVNIKDGRVSIYVKSSGAAGESEDGSDYRYFEGDPADSEGAKEYVEQVTKELNKSGTEKYHPIFLSENAITLSDKVQIVIRFTGNPEEIHRNYDYIHAVNYYYSKTRQLVLKAEALESLLAKNLIYQGSLYPVCSLFRMRKFMDRGWRISAGEITKMAMQISELDLKNPFVLREQLIGVDAAYFHELLRLIEEWKNNNEGKSIDSSYVIQLIDQLADRI